MNMNRLIETGAITGPYKRTKPIRTPQFWLDLRDLMHDLAYAFRQARSAWQFVRHMRRCGNPDELPF